MPGKVSAKASRTPLYWRFAVTPNRDKNTNWSCSVASSLRNMIHEIAAWTECSSTAARRLIALLIVCLPWQPARIVAADGDVRSPKRTIDLFNGRDLQAWYPYLRHFGRSDARDVFRVRDGVLRISGDVDGYLSTESSWRDYRLSLEFRWGRSNHLGKSRRWTDTFNFGRADSPEDRSDSWNRIECLCAGDRIRVFLNGQLVNAAEDVFPHSGPILLQSEGSEIYFRRIQLHPLPAGSPGRPIGRK